MNNNPNQNNNNQEDIESSSCNLSDIQVHDGITANVKSDVMSRY